MHKRYSDTIKPNNLPKSWQIKKLGEVCDFNFGCSFKASDFNEEGRGLPVVRTGDIGQITAVKFYDKDYDDKYLIEKGDILIGLSGSIKIDKWKGEEALLNQRVVKLYNFKPEILKEFIFYQLPIILKELEIQISQSTVKNVLLPHLSNLKVLISPPPIQHRIVKKIDEIFENIDKARNLREEAIEETENFIPSALNEIFRKAEKERWVEKAVSDVCTRPQYGYTASANFEKIGPHFLRITDIQNGWVDWEKVPYCSCDEVGKYRLSSGDILFARSGATTGKSYLVKDCPGSVFGSYLIRIKALKEIIPEYLYWFFQSSDYWSQVFEEKVGGAQPNMNGQKLAAVKLPVPPLPQQHHIVKYLDSLQTQTSRLKQLQSETQKELNELKKSILDKAFKGELN